MISQVHILNFDLNFDVSVGFLKLENVAVFPQKEELTISKKSLSLDQLHESAIGMKNPV